MSGIMLLTVAGGMLGMRLVFQDEEAAELDDEGMAVGQRWR